MAYERETKMTELEESWDRYTSEAHGYALAQFYAIVRPFCREHGFSFYTGETAEPYYLSKEGMSQFNPHDWAPEYLEAPYADELQLVVDTLEIRVPGLPQPNCLGSLMPCYVKKEE